MYTGKEVRVSREYPALELGTPSNSLSITFDEVRKAAIGTAWTHTVESCMGIGGEHDEAKIIDKDEEGALIRVVTTENGKTAKETTLVYVEFMKR